MIIPTRNSMIPTVTVPALRELTVARFSYEGDASVELVAPIAVVRAQNTAASVAGTVRPGRRSR